MKETLTDDVILYIENSKNTKKLLTLIKELVELQNAKFCSQKSVVFLHINCRLPERKIRRLNPTYHHIRKNKSN